MSEISTPRRVSVVTMGCARNDVDSEELAGRLAERGWALTEDDADVVVVNTCGFIDAAKKDSIDAVLAAADSGSKVVAVGCLAQRYGKDLAEQLPEADAVLSFDDYSDISDRLDDVLAGKPLVPHTPSDRRTLLPIAPVERQQARVATPGHGDDRRGRPASGPRVLRSRLVGGPTASLKLASGCDRRCTFCAIPSFRGSFISRRPEDVLDEAQWLADDGVREIVLVSENSTSYGKDLGDVRLLESFLPRLAEVEGIERIRVAYLQPAEMRPGLLEVLLGTPKLAPYLDLSFQHSSPRVLRRMKRFGSTDAFLGLIEQARALAPEVGVRTNVIVGFPGETDEDLLELERFLTEGRLDAVGVFGYSDEEGTAAVALDGHLGAGEIADRVERVTALVDELSAQRAEDRLGEHVVVLVEDVDGDLVEGRAAHQGPEVDGTTALTGAGAARARIGDLVPATIIDTDGVDLVAEAQGA
ncbi:30S ribosomal protein S12 methylthiotransferase RimO [Cumulibacter manganitolerans]|uniref:30S ribosomal protein S12 methylthiotransferase RimO n=1 Tax=Cumulibacter manganitolerans TaxID=1884992 RepID=UPI001E58910D|nr:30S ribosomal protein S12 methylthiotransferase RimO [Cumulibacter manganitolerans]